MTLKKLYSIIRQRIEALPENSYVATLFRQGVDAILQKIGEEATEVIIAAKGKNKQRIIEEMSDLYFMSLLVMAIKGISPDDVYKELEKRRK